MIKKKLITLNKWQSDVFTDPHRFKVICAGRRAGKSVLLRMMILKLALETPGLYWIVSPTYKQSKSIHWRDYKNEIPPEVVLSKNEVELSIELKNGSRIELKGAEDVDKLRGVKLNFLGCDEIDSWKNFKDAWQEVLRPTLTDYAAPAMFIGTPKGFRDLYDLYLMGQPEGDVNYKSWTYTTYDNPIIPRAEIETARAELTEDAFAQEYMAEFREFVGLVYKDFSRSRHVVTKDYPFTPVFYLIGHDPGFTNPRAVPIIAVDKDGNWLQVDEIYQTKLTNPEAAELIKGKIKGLNVDLHVMDSAHASDIQEMNDLGINFVPVRKESGESSLSWVQYKIRKFSERLRNGKYKVLDGCTNTIWEFERYQYPDKKDNSSEPETPLKVNDHMMDSLGDVNVMYLHTYEEKEVKPWEGKIKGTYIEPSVVEEDDGDLSISVDINEMYGL